MASTSPSPTPSFHFGVQYAGDQGDWATGVAHSARSTHQVFPSLHGSVMIWPDNGERNGGGSAGYFTAPAASRT